MADSGGGEDYSDVDFDGLDAETLHQLQEKAFRATQTAWDSNDEDDAEAYEIPQAPALEAGKPDQNGTGTGQVTAPSAAIRTSIARRGSPDGQAHRVQSAQHLSHVSVASDEVTQRELWRRNRFSAEPVKLSNGGSAALEAAEDGSLVAPQKFHATGNPSLDVPRFQGSKSDARGDEDLARELEELRQERDQLRQALKLVQDQNQAKAGEVAIVRSIQARAAKEHERRLEELQQQQQRDQQRHRTELDQARQEKENLVTHHRFLDNEHNDQAWPSRPARGLDSSKRVTPRRGHHPSVTSKLPLRDGFEDDEIMVQSPSKSAGGRSKPPTPKSTSKRKRDALSQSSAQPLEINCEDTGNSVEPKDDYIPLRGPSGNAIAERKRLDLLHVVMHHRREAGGKRSLEILTTHSLPSDLNKSLGALVLDAIDPLRFADMTVDPAGFVGSALIAVWSRCLSEQYYSALPVLMDLVQTTLMHGTAESAELMMDELVVVAQQTADVNIIPRYMRFKRKPANKPTDDRLPSPDINLQSCLQILEMVVLKFRRRPAQIERFWRLMRFDFISMLLRNSQTTEDVSLLVRLLTTSVRPTSFAMIVAPPASQSASEQHVIDRLSAMLIEVPRVAEGEPQVQNAAVEGMRLQILNLLEVMCSKRYCGEAFVQHPLAIGRLVRALYEANRALYEYRSGHEQRIQIVNQSVRLLAFLTANYSEALGDLQEKLRAPPTNVYKYLIVLSRLAFSDGLLLERGIDDDVLETAHGMLEDLVTPEEGEALQRVYLRDER